MIMTVRQTWIYSHVCAGANPNQSRNTRFQFDQLLIILELVIVAGLGLILLAVLDTFWFHREHAVLLLICLMGRVISMMLATIVYFDQAWHPSPFKWLSI